MPIMAATTATPNADVSFMEIVSLRPIAGKMDPAIRSTPKYTTLSLGPRQNHYRSGGGLVPVYTGGWRLWASDTSPQRFADEGVTQ
ncbi:MAG: hypothetical protein KAS74_07470 [Methanosarcinales archaeon]|nr:hypothetical protein [Methanosarcinales archaeon]